MNNKLIEEYRNAVNDINTHAITEYNELLDKLREDHSFNGYIPSPLSGSRQPSGLYPQFQPGYHHLPQYYELPQQSICVNTESAYQVIVEYNKRMTTANIKLATANAIFESGKMCMIGTGYNIWTEPLCYLGLVSVYMLPSR
jgi:hypothetical protein